MMIKIDRNVKQAPFLELHCYRILIRINWQRQSHRVSRRNMHAVYWPALWSVLSGHNLVPLWSLGTEWLWWTPWHSFPGGGKAFEQLRKTRIKQKMCTWNHPVVTQHKGTAEELARNPFSGGVQCVSAFSSTNSGLYMCLFAELHYKLAQVGSHITKFWQLSRTSFVLISFLLIL